MTQAVAFWTVGRGRGELRSHALDQPGPGEVQVRARYSGISRGSEGLVLGGKAPASEHGRMRAPFQQGAFPWPVKYGYSSVGRVTAGASELVGKRVFCLHPHQDHYVVPADAVHVVPDDVPARRAVLAANMETAVNAMWDARPAVGARIAVVGAGVVGLLVGHLAAGLPGTRVQLVDVNPARAALAAQLGCGFALPDEAHIGCDHVFHASGSSQGLATALRLAGDEAEIIELSWYGDAEVSAPLGAAFHPGRLTLRSSQVGRLPLTQLRRWNHAERLRLALSLLAQPVLEHLLDGPSPFSTLPQVLPRVAAPDSGALCHVVDYEKD